MWLDLQDFLLLDSITKSSLFRGPAAKLSFQNDEIQLQDVWA